MNKNYTPHDIFIKTDLIDIDKNSAILKDYFLKDGDHIDRDA